MSSDLVVQGRRASSMSKAWQRLRIGLCELSGLPIDAFNRFTLGPPNEHFKVESSQLQAEMQRLRANPKPLARPVLIFSGYRVPGIFGGQLASRLAKLTSGNIDDFRLFAYPWTGDIPTVVDRIARIVANEYGLANTTQGAEQTNPVDVIGISMGGIVGRLAAAKLRPRPDGVPRINMRKLFTIATPHRGARLALKIHVDQAACDMQPGSGFLAKLAEYNRADDFELVPYATLNDITVGASNCSPEGSHPIWIQGTKRFAHTTVTMHPAIALDIALRLRGEPPIGTPSLVPSL